MVKYRQGIAIIDTADPILFRFLARADTGDVAVPPERALFSQPPLADSGGSTTSPPLPAESNTASPAPTLRIAELVPGHRGQL